MNNFIAEDTAATCAHRAHMLLDQAAERKCWPAREGYEDNSSTALRDALVGQGLATLAVQAELAGIAESLRLLAKTPAAIDLLASHVTAESARLQKELEDTRAKVVDLRSSVEVGGQPIATAIGNLTAAVDALGQAAEPRPRWWQWRIRRALRAAAEPQETAQ